MHGLTKIVTAAAGLVMMLVSATVCASAVLHTSSTIHLRHISHPRNHPRTHSRFHASGVVFNKGNNVPLHLLKPGRHASHRAGAGGPIGSQPGKGPTKSTDPIDKFIKN
jgi:hypothetical protein